jgi:hypothetical protein
MVNLVGPVWHGQMAVQQRLIELPLCVVARLGQEVVGAPAVAKHGVTPAEMQAIVWGQIRGIYG